MIVHAALGLGLQVFLVTLGEHLEILVIERSRGWRGWRCVEEGMGAWAPIVTRGDLQEDPFPGVQFDFLGSPERIVVDHDAVVTILGRDGEVLTVDPYVTEGMVHLASLS
jgi:hypothetical protein